MQTTIRFFAIVFLLCFQIACSADSDDKKANKLYIQASLIVKNLKNDLNKKEGFLLNYEKSHSLISQIISDYSSSDIAVKLVSEQVKISGFSLDKFNKIEHSLALISDAENNPISCAKLITKQQVEVSESATKIAAFSNIYIKIGEKQKANDLMTKSLSIWEGKDKAEKLRMVIPLSKFVVTKKHYQQIVKYIGSLKEKKNNTLNYSAQQFARAGHFDEAKKMTTLINNRDDLDDAYSSIFSEEMTLKNIPTILEKIDIIKNSYRKSLVQTKAIKLFLSINDIDSALKIHKKIKSTEFESLIIIIEQLTKAGKKEEAISQLNKAIVLARKEINVNGERVGAIAIVARLYYSNDNKEKAKSLFKEAINISTSRSMHISAKTTALLKVAKQYTQINEHDLANKILIKATNITHKLTKLKKTRLMLGSPELDYQYIRNAYVNNGGFKKAQKIKKNYIKGRDYDVYNFLVAESYINTGELEKALKYIKLEPWDNYKTPYLKNKIVSIYIENNKVELAENIIKTMKEGYNKTNSIKEMINYLVSNNKYDKAIATTQGIKSKLQQAEALTEIGLSMKKEKASLNNDSKKILTSISNSLNPLQTILH